MHSIHLMIKTSQSDFMILTKKWNFPEEIKVIWIKLKQNNLRKKLPFSFNSRPVLQFFLRQVSQNASNGSLIILFFKSIAVWTEQLPYSLCFTGALMLFIALPCPAVYCFDGNRGLLKRRLIPYHISHIDHCRWPACNFTVTTFTGLVRDVVSFRRKSLTTRCLWQL